MAKQSETKAEEKPPAENLGEENAKLKEQLAASERDRESLREALSDKAKLPPAGQTVAARPKKEEDPKQVQENCRAALARLGRDPDSKLSDEETAELASLHVAYPEGAMFERAVAASYRVRRQREQQEHKKAIK